MQITIEPPVGYEAAHVRSFVPALVAHNNLLDSTRESLRATFERAMRGDCKTVLHVERRGTGSEVVAPCPVAEAIGEAMEPLEISHTLVQVLRHSESEHASALRALLAQRYADTQAPRILAVTRRANTRGAL